MKEVAIPAMPRSEFGKNAARRVRAAGEIPGIMYGPETKPKSVAVNEREFRAAVKEAGGVSAIFDLKVGGKKNKVILRELQRDPVSSKVIHIDFHAISMNKPIHISVPIHFVGTPDGVKNDGGIMQTTLRELDVSCLPKDIPEHFEIDVTELSIGESVHVRDVSIPNAEILNETQRTIVVISAPTVMKVEEPAEDEELEGDEAAAEGEEGAEGTEAKPAEGAAATDEKKEGDKK